MYKELPDIKKSIAFVVENKKGVPIDDAESNFQLYSIIQDVYTAEKNCNGSWRAVFLAEHLGYRADVPLAEEDYDKAVRQYKKISEKEKISFLKEIGLLSSLKK